ncbi:Protein F42A10.7 [Aphelenchoides avenae]|nr:Protein F42A10.7 [Aphelenchus avenae]
MALTSLQLLVLLAFCSYGTFACVKFPNGTDKALNWWSCGQGDITIYSLVAQDAGGKPEYPIHLATPLNVGMNITNTAGTIKNIQLDISLWQWGGWTGCSWHSILTFGLLSGLDACTNGFPCPVSPGNQNIKAVIDFSKYGSIIGLLKNDSPYQVQYKLTDKDTGRSTCTMIQARALTKN